MVASVSIGASAPAAQEAPKLPPAPDRGRDDGARARERDFEDALKRELAQAHPIVLPTLPSAPLPFNPQTATDQAMVQAIAGAGPKKTSSRGAMATPFVIQPRRSFGQEAPVPVPKKQPKGPEPQAVPILVEPGLPPVQPFTPHTQKTVPLVQFPQLVAGHVQQMVKNDQPVTQLTVQISPPNLGPVQIQLQLVDRAVNVQLVASGVAEQQALESQKGAIQSILVSQNFTPGPIKVVAAGKSGQAAMRGDQQQGASFFAGSRRRRSASDDLSVEV